MGKAVLLSVCVLAVVTALAWVALRELPLPAGTQGPFTVGTTALRFTPAQLERWSDTDPDRPVPEVALWYPVSPATTASRLQDLLRLRLTGHRLLSCALDGAPPVAGTDRLPVLLYFPGWPGTTPGNQTAIYALASHGFVVATVVYGSRRPGVPEAAYQHQLQALERSMDFSTGASAQATVQLADSRTRARAQDASAILDAITLLDAGEGTSVFRNRFDLRKVGIFGYSFGGAIAAQAGLIDSRVGAVANLDGWQFAEAATAGVPKPYLLMSDATPLPTPAELGSSDAGARALATLNDQDYRRARNNLQRLGGYFLTIYGTDHGSFADAPLNSAWQWPWAKSGSTSRLRAMRIVNTYLLGFFEHELLGRSTGLFNSKSSGFPEVHLEAWNAGPVAPQGQ